MADISKERLRKEIVAILKDADLTKLSGKKLRQQLEKIFEVDLEDQKKLVDELAMEILKENKSYHLKVINEDKQEAETKNGAVHEGEDENDNEDDNEDEDDNEVDNEDDDEVNDEDEDENEGSDKEKQKKVKKRTTPKKAKYSESEDYSDDEDEDEYSPKKKIKTSVKNMGSRKIRKGSDDDSDEDWAKAKSRKTGVAAGAVQKKGNASASGSGKGGYTKPCTLSPELAKLVGQDTMPRHEVVKKIWAIIKERNLFDPNNKQFAICDSELAEIFVVKRFRTFGMMKYLKNHFVS